ncbi:hypothetical protein [Pseudonocardia sp. EC080610-09]|nr:hypothetical protein [Pseudonocardia sp. EC080610-09]
MLINNSRLREAELATTAEGSFPSLPDCMIADDWIGAPTVTPPRRVG